MKTFSVLKDGRLSHHFITNKDKLVFEPIKGKWSASRITSSLSHIHVHVHKEGGRD